MAIKIEISDRLADELRDWVKNEMRFWPDDTAYMDDLADLLRQLEVVSAEDVRGILAGPEPIKD